MNLVPRQAGQYHRTSFETLIKPSGRALMLHRCLVVFYVWDLGGAVHCTIILGHITKGNRVRPSQTIERTASPKIAHLSKNIKFFLKDVKMMSNTFDIIFVKI